MNARYLAYALLLAWAVIGFLLALALSGCEGVPTAPMVRTVLARITVYNKHEDRFGSRIAMTNRFCAAEGRTMAAPSVLPFGTRVVVPQLRGIVGSGQFTIEDRGSALERAYRRGQLRLDVYVASRSKLRRLQFGMPEFMEAELQ